MKLFGRRKQSLPVLYTARQMKIIEKFVEEHIGPIDNVFHEIVSPDVHVDILSIPPAGERNYHTLCTMGMGARKMDVPAQYRKNAVDRAEVMVALPPDWKLDSHDENDYWPLRSSCCKPRGNIRTAWSVTCLGRAGWHSGRWRRCTGRKLQYNIENGTEALFEHFGPEFSYVVCPCRKNGLLQEEICDGRREKQRR
ncbi:MAG: suppressor of fused domain protein [Rikenellaceae bacterium]|jgi:hypothetical protein|nr:suppressor of fused domain protein [Rikenellaceae bacterium]